MSSKWHYICKEQVVFPGNDIRTGEYFDYLKDTFDYLINDNNWVQDNEAWDEADWILDNLDKMLESNNGEIIFIPTIETANRIDAYYAQEEIDYVAKHMYVEF